MYAWEQFWKVDVTSCKYAQINPIKCHQLSKTAKPLLYISICDRLSLQQRVQKKICGAQVSGLIDNGKGPNQRGWSVSFAVNHLEGEIRHKSQLLLRNL